ncbi:MAG TPA: hypothetical protein VEA78_12260 [Acidimicrobiales bacterium]|nr:hypothetical protein [Acidimicrobiales bacterium]
MPGVRRAAIGTRVGRANALTVLLPLAWGGRTWLRFVFWLYRRRRGGDFLLLDRLRFVSAIRWSLVPPLDDDDRWWMLFESNFDGDWDEYLDSFGAVTGSALRRLLWRCVGYPGLTSPALFKEYARIHDHRPEHYASAHPHLTASDIRQALHAQHGDAAEAEIAREGYGRSKPSWSTFLLRLDDGAAGRAIRAARALPEDALLGGGDVHFGRVAVVERPTGAWLLITLTHDGDAATVVRRIVANDVGGKLRALLEHAADMPDASQGWWSDDRLTELLLLARPTASRRSWVAYCAYAGRTVGEIAPLQPVRDRLPRR